MRRVVITGMGIISSLGNNTQQVDQALRAAKSGISRNDEQAEMGFRSHVAGNINLNLDEALDRKELRFMGPASAYPYLALREAIADAGLEEAEVSNARTGVVAGSGGPSTSWQTFVSDTTREKGTKRVGPTQVPKIMSSTVSAILATSYKIKGVNYSITSACSTSAHCIGHGAELIQFGKQDRVFVGGGEELTWSLTAAFDAMGALSSKYNDNPSVASRAYDQDRDGFVISGGGGMLVLEDYELAKARGAKIYAELIGYGATSDGYDMVAPSGEGAERCMNLALSTTKGRKIDYINAHGTSTPVGDLKETEAVRTVFGEDMPYISSTKSLTGHALGAAGVNEAIYSLLMMQGDYLTRSAHIDQLDPALGDANILRENIENAKIDSVMSNSFGFGGTNATLIFGRV